MNIEEIVSNIKKFNKICLDHGATLVLASKTVPAETLKEVAAMYPGNLIFGENRAQEFREKYFEAENLQWHFIGRLQSNKLKYILGKVSLIQSVDSAKLLDEISALSVKKKIVSDFLMEINFGGEENKGGISPEEAERFAAYASRLDGVRLRGIMSVLPIGGDVAGLTKQAKAVSDRLVSIYGEKVSIVSIGMSEDYDVALQNSSNMIRIGSAVFGKRSYQ